MSSSRTAPYQTKFKRSTLAAAITLALLSTSANAQTATPPVAESPKTTTDKRAEDKTDTLALDKIVITGTAASGSKMKQSVSVSTLNADTIQQNNAGSAAEVLRSIPGVRSESSGGESNANVTVRGVPISAGGGRYVQYQEDGLPVIQIGDLQFATADAWLRVDSMLDRLEVVRGGAASTVATSAPGGIFNFISNTGEEQGGSVSISRGLDFNSTRYDFGYGGPVGTDTRFYVAGFYRNGEGMRNGGVNVEGGGQIRGNVTRTFNGGYVRLSFKHLDDRTPTLLPVPVRFVNGKIETISGVDPRRASFYSPYLPVDNTLTIANTRVSNNINDGLSAKTDAFGAEASFDLGWGLQVTDKFRNSKNSGRFIGLFPGDDAAPAVAGTKYANGPKAGQAYTGLANSLVAFNTSIDNADLVANDLKVNKTFDLGGGSKVVAGGGFYTSTQTVGTTWNFNQYYVETNGDKPALLTSASNGTPGFGGCCSNFIDADMVTTAPYASLAFESGPWNVDASIRRDELKVTGTVNQTNTGGGTAVGGTKYDPNLAQPINYKVSNTSYSVGANYQIDKNLALFLRTSKGAAFNGDRNVFFTDPRAFNGSSPVPVNEVKQVEAGVKWRSGAMSIFGTVFQAKTSETNIDVTTTPIKRTATSYDAKGFELEGGYRMGGLKLTAGLTYTDAVVTASTNAAIVNKTPRRQAEWLYQLGSSYDIGAFTVGANLVGTTDSKDDSPAGPISVTLPGYNIVNGFASYNVTPNASVSLGVNNLFDKLGYTESNDGRGAARAVNGRSTKITFKYTF